MKRLTWDTAADSEPESAARLVPAAGVETRGQSEDRLPHLRIAMWWLAAWVALSLLALPAIQQQGQVPMFFRAGLSVALILWAGPRHIPMVLAAWMVTLPLVSQFPATPAAMTVARAVALVGPFALGCMALRQMHFDIGLRRQRDAVLFLTVGVFLPAIPSALAADAMGFSMLERTLPTVVSILCVTPFLLVSAVPYLEKRWNIGRSAARSGESIWSKHAPLVIVGAAAAIGALMWLAHLADQIADVNIYFLCFLPIAWVAVRYGVSITANVVFATAIAVAVLQTFALPEAVLNNTRLATLFFSAAGLVLAAIVEERKQQADTIRRLAEVAHKSGSPFFDAVAANLGEALESDIALICEMTSPHRVRSLAIWADGKPGLEIEYGLEGTPCARVTEGNACLYKAQIQAKFPLDRLLVEMRAEAYAGTPLRSSTGECLGLMAVIYRRPLNSTGRIEAGLAAFASRTAAELERLRNEEAIRYSEQRYRALAQNSQESIWRLEFDPPVPVELPEEELMQRMLQHGYVADINDYGARMRGGTREDLLGMRLTALAEREVAPLETLQRVMRSGFHFSHGVYGVRTETGNLMYVRRSAFGVVENGLILRIWGTGQDVTELVRAQEEIRKLNAGLEDQVARRTLELDAAVKELEAFSYSASHDLRAPLLGILGSSRALVEDYRETLSPDAREWLDRIQQDAHYMDQLLHALLGLTRVSRADLLWQKIDLGEVAGTVAVNLRSREPGRQVCISIAEDLRTSGDPALLRMVMENLIGNAWKFTRGREPARIEIGKQPHNGDHAYYVRDTGAGFDPRYASRLFTAFQRLHGKEFEGTGIGLATVQRVIHRHGGEVWAEGVPGAGATFYFTLGQPAIDMEESAERNLEMSAERTAERSMDG